MSTVLAAALLLTACGSDTSTKTSPAADDRPAASVGQPEPSTSAPAETPVDTTDEATEAEATEAETTEEEATEDEATEDEATQEEAPAGDSSDGGTEGLPGWPVESVPVHGARLWAAYLAVGTPGDPALQEVLAEVQRSWPGAALGELGCDEGAAAALGRDPAEHAVAVYFATEQHITEFRRRWESPFIGAVHVTTLCGD